MKRMLPALAILLLGCGSREPAATGGTDLLPRWKAGDVFEVREETRRYRGDGPFPAAGEVEARTESIERTLDVYRMEVIRAEGTRLLRTRRRYVSSLAGTGDELRPTALDGKTYEVERPFGECRVEVPGPEGARTPAPEEEALRVRLCLLRMAASLLPGRPVRPGATWTPGRDLDAFQVPGRKEIRMVPRLTAVKRVEGRTLGIVSARTEVRMLSGPLGSAHIVMEEILRMDLDAHRFGSYAMETQWYLPPGPRRPQNWRLILGDLTLTPSK